MKIIGIVVIVLGIIITVASSIVLLLDIETKHPHFALMCEYIFDGNFKYIKLIGTLIGCAITFAGMIIYFVGGGEIRAQRNTVLLSIFIGMAIGGAVGAVCAMHAYLDKKPDLLLIPLLWESLMIVALCIGLCYYGWQ